MVVLWDQAAVTVSHAMNTWKAVGLCFFGGWLSSLRVASPYYMEEGVKAILINHPAMFVMDIKKVSIYRLVCRWNCWDYGNSMFSFLKAGQVLCHSGCTVLHSHQPCLKGSNFSTSSPTLLIFSSLLKKKIIAVPGSEKRYLTTALIFSSPMTNSAAELLHAFRST